MLTIVFLSLAALGQDDELLRVFMAPGSWTAAVSRFEGRAVDERDIADVACVGIFYADMFCSWQRREQHQWRRYTGRADLSSVDGPRIRDARPEK